jgi:hypothetical protein
VRSWLLDRCVCMNGFGTLDGRLFLSSWESNEASRKRCLVHDGEELES